MICWEQSFSSVDGVIPLVTVVVASYFIFAKLFSFDPTENKFHL
jgi:hypothetical protein